MRRKVSAHPKGALRERFLSFSSFVARVFFGPPAGEVLREQDAQWKGIPGGRVERRRVRKATLATVRERFLRRRRLFFSIFFWAIFLLLVLFAFLSFWSLLVTPLIAENWPLRLVFLIGSVLAIFVLWSWIRRVAGIFVGGVEEGKHGKRRGER